MNTELEPPRVPPLSTAERARMRNRLMERTRPGTRHPARHWVAPLVGVAAVGAVVAATLVLTDKPSTDAGVAGKSAPDSASISSGDATIDLGVVPPTLLPKFRSDCGGSAVKMLWTRHIRGFSGKNTRAVALVVERRPQKHHLPPNTDTIDLGARLCITEVPVSADGVATSASLALNDKAWTARPTAAQGLVSLCTCAFPMSQDHETLQMITLYRARPEIARVQARSIWKGKFGAWTEGVVDGGFVYTQPEAHGKFVQGQIMKQEVRAFDAAGHQVPVKLPEPG